MPYRLLLLCLVLSSCTSTNMMETAMYFGRSKPDGSMVTESEWKSFTEKHVTTVFTEGSTVFSANGTWLDSASKKLITEPTYVAVYYYRKSANKSKQIDSLRVLYKTLFNQSSVLRVDKKVKAEF